MAIAEAAQRRPWWSRLPESWIQMSPPEERERDRADETGSMYRRRWEDNLPPPPQAPRVQVPLGVVVSIVIYLAGQLIGGVWWAATLQSNQNHEMTDRAREEQRLWESIEVCKLKSERLEANFDERVRVKVKEILDDWGYLRVRPRKED